MPLTQRLLGILCILFFACNSPEEIRKDPDFISTYSRLPIGAIKPTGWLEQQLKIQANGLTGNLNSFWPDIQNSAWKGKDGEAWERGPYFLDGLVPLAYQLNDEQLIAQTKPFIEWMLASLQPNGWFGPENNPDRWPRAVALKVMTQYYEATGDERALNLVKQFVTNYILNHPPDWPDGTWRGVRAMEHADVAYWLYRETGDSLALKAAKSIRENSFDWDNYFNNFPWTTDALREGRIPKIWDTVGMTAHVVNIAMATKYPGLWYQQSKNEQHKATVYEGINNLDKYHGQIGGRFSGDEHISGKEPTRGTELCSVVEYMYSLERLFETLGDVHLADRLEYLAYNAWPATVSADYWTHQYDQQTNQVLVSDAERPWSSNGNQANIFGLQPNFACCLANMHQGWPKFVAHMWMATEDNGLAAVTYGPNTVSTLIKGETALTITSKTDYPFTEEIEFQLKLNKTATIPLYFRIPHWAKDATLKIGDETINASAGSMAKLERAWKDGDRILLVLPAKTETIERENGAVAIKRGPLYFGLRIQKDYEKIDLGKASLIYKGATDWQISPASPWNYALQLNPGKLDEQVTVKRSPVTEYPFADTGEMVFTGDQYKIWTKSAPLVLEIKGIKVPQWTMANHSAGPVPKSPMANLTAPAETIELVPYGSTRLRIAEFPWIRP